MNGVSAMTDLGRQLTDQANAVNCPTSKENEERGTELGDESITDVSLVGSTFRVIGACVLVPYCHSVSHKASSVSSLIYDVSGISKSSGTRVFCFFVFFWPIKYE